MGGGGGGDGIVNYFGTDIGLNIPYGLNTEVLCGSRIDPQAKLILEHNYACKTANLIDPRLDKTHHLLENTHLIRIYLSICLDLYIVCLPKLKWSTVTKPSMHKHSERLLVNKVAPEVLCVIPRTTHDQWTDLSDLW